MTEARELEATEPAEPQTDQEWIRSVLGTVSDAVKRWAEQIAAAHERETTGGESSRGDSKQ